MNGKDLLKQKKTKTGIDSKYNLKGLARKYKNIVI